MASHEPSLAELSSSTPSEAVVAVVPSQLCGRDQPVPENHSNPQQDGPTDYVSGFKLVTIAISMALALFLVLIDTMVISTVCHLAIRLCSFTLL